MIQNIYSKNSLKNWKVMRIMHITSDKNGCLLSITEHCIIWSAKESPESAAVKKTLV